MDEHERLFVLSFIRKDKQARLLELLGRPKSRMKALRELTSGTCFKDELRIPIPPASSSCEGIERMLRAMGAPDTCRVLKGIGEEDGLVALTEALAVAVGSSSEVVVSCIPGKLAYWEGDWGARFILRSPG